MNRIKSTLIRLGIRNFKPTLRKAADRLATVHTPEGMPLPPNTLAELQRDMARLGFVVSQIRQIEEARQKRLEQQHETGSHAMVRLLARIVDKLTVPVRCVQQLLLWWAPELHDRWRRRDADDDYRRRG